uniref:Uncharacterized protein n=1 Tax=Fervidobacterium pennivorans TaxID=93466 RepID=A0A7V4KEK8_FERPE
MFQIKRIYHIHFEELREFINQIIEPTDRPFLTYDKLWDKISNHIANYGAELLVITTPEKAITLSKDNFSKSDIERRIPEIYEYCLEQGVLLSSQDSLESAYLEPFVFKVEEYNSYLAYGAVFDLTKDLEKQIKNMADEIGTKGFLIRTRSLGYVFLSYYSGDLADFLRETVTELLSNTSPQPKYVPYRYEGNNGLEEPILFETEIKYPLVINTPGEKKLMFRIYANLQRQKDPFENEYKEFYESMHFDPFDTSDEDD